VKKPSKKPANVTSKKQSASSTKPLPTTFQGAAVVRGQGLGSDEVDDLLEREALAEFDATHDLFLVLPGDALVDLDASTQVHGFRDEKIALRYAQAMGNGNVDQRVLRVTQQTLVVGTMNDL
jgi:hypothetical protein